MLKTISLPIAAIALLTACSGEPVTYEATPVSIKRAYADSFQDMPFDTGEISVVAEEGGDLQTFTLRPCGDGHVCGARQGDVVKAPDYHVVTGAYAGRIFCVSPGGDGWIKQNGTFFRWLGIDRTGDTLRHGRPAARHRENGA